MPSTINTAKSNNIILDDVLDLTKDIVISGEFSFFGSLLDGGEGFCVFLLDANSSGNVGSPGPGLGFAPSVGKGEYLGNDIFEGTDQSLLGVAFDQVGDFAQPLGGSYTSGTTSKPKSVSLRYGSSGNKNFEYIDSSVNLLSTYGLELYELIGYKYPSVTATATSTRSQTPTKTFTNTVNSTLTSTATNTVTRTSTQSRTNTQTRTPTNTVTYSSTGNSCVATPTPTRTISPTLSQTKTSTPTNTPTNNAINAKRKAFKVRITNFGKKVIVYFRNDAYSNFVKVYEYDNLNLEMPLSGKTKVGLSYATGVNTSAFHIYNFSVNGIGYENPFTPTPTATRGLTSTATRTPTLTNTVTVSLTINPTLTPTQSRTNTRTNTPTQTCTQYATPSKTLTYTPTQTRTSTQSRTSTQAVTRTQTPTQSRTNTQTSTTTRTNTQTRTSSQTPTQTQTPTPAASTPFVTEQDATYKFVFESKWDQSDSAAAAVNVLINNARFGFNKNTSSSNLLNIRTDSNPGGVVNDFANTYFRAFFFNSNANTAQQQGQTAPDGQSSWLGIPFVENKQLIDNPDTDFRRGISSNIYQALQLLVTTGSSLSATLLDIDKDDNSLASAGSNYNLWNLDGLSSDYKTPTFDLNLSNLYVANFDNTGNILYNTDYIDGTTTKDNFLATPDNYRLIPNVRYLIVNDNEIGITFSYCTELIYYSDTDNQSSYWGARLTLFTNVRQ